MLLAGLRSSRALQLPPDAAVGIPTGWATLEPDRKIKIRFPRKSWFDKTSLFVQITQPASYRLVYKRNIYREFNQKAHSITAILEAERMSTCPCPDPDHNPTKHYAKSVTRTFLTAFPATAALENSGSHTGLATATTDRQANARKPG